MLGTATEPATGLGHRGVGRRLEADPGTRSADGGYVTLDPARRRVVLAAAAALPLAAVSGCQGLGVLSTPPPPPADVVALQAAIAAEKLMVAQYATALRSARTWPAGAAQALQPLHAEHQAHLAQLQSRLVVPPGSAASASPSGHATAAPAVPSTPAAAIAVLKTAEQAAVTAMLGRLTHAPAALAQLFASISASEATHVPALDRAAQAAG